MSVRSEKSEKAALINYAKSPISSLYEIQTHSNVEGSIDELKSSPVRRTFCLIVLFGLVICFIIWILFVQIINSNKNGNGYKSEVLNYTFKSSLFDVVCFQTVKFIFLETAYGYVKSSFPWFIAGSTTATSAFVIAKTVLYKSPIDSAYKIIGYILLLTVLVISWTETLFLIYQVLPKEKAAKRVFEYYRYLSEQYGHDGDRIIQTPTADPELGDQDFIDAISEDDDDEEFFSPKQTRPASPTKLMNKEILNLCKDLKEMAGRVTNDTQNWKYISGDAVNGFITSKDINSLSGKCFKVECFLNVPPEVLYRDFIYNVENTPQWNTDIQYVKRVVSISENVDIVYNITNDILKGYISSRDFVIIRMWGSHSNKYFIYTKSCEHPDYPPQANLVRGENIIGSITFESGRLDQNQTKCVWIMNNDLKGKLFRTVVDKTMPKIMQGMLTNFRKYTEKLEVQT